MATKDRPIPGPKYQGIAKKPAPKRLGTKPAAGKKIPQPPASFSHGKNTQRYATEGEIKSPRY